MAHKNTPPTYRKRDENWGKVACRIEGCTTTAGVAGLCTKHRRQGAEFIETRRTMARGVTVADLKKILEDFPEDAELNKLRVDFDSLTVATGDAVESWNMRVYPLKHAE